MYKAVVPFYGPATRGERSVGAFSNISLEHLSLRPVRDQIKSCQIFLTFYVPESNVWVSAYIDLGVSLGLSVRMFANIKASRLKLKVLHSL